MGIAAAKPSSPAPAAPAFERVIKELPFHFILAYKVFPHGPDIQPSLSVVSRPTKKRGKIPAFFAVLLISSFPHAPGLPPPPSSWQPRSPGHSRRSWRPPSGRRQRQRQQRPALIHSAALSAFTPPVGIIFICGMGPLMALMILGPNRFPGKIFTISEPASMHSTASLMVIAPAMQAI